MKRLLKNIIIALLVISLLAVGSYALLYFGFGIKLFDRSGWSVSPDGYVQYLDKRGEPLALWQQIDEDWYYFDPGDENAMVTGWLELDGLTYYLATDGKRQNGWIELPDGTYYTDPDSGIAATGWLELDGLTYYLDDTSRRCTGWTEIGDCRYFFSEAGTMVTGWLTTEEGTYYLDGATGIVASGMTEIAGLRYFFAEDGAMATGWTDTENGTCYLDEATGVMVTGWVEDESGRRYLDEDTGLLVTGWMETEEGTLYLGADGYICTGWTDTENGTYYLDEDGYPVTGWLEENGSRYYLDEQGQMALGWLTLENTTYYFQEDGTMAVGKVIIDDLPRYFSSTGAYVVLVNNWNAVPEGYCADLVSFGQWQVDASCYDALVKMLEDCPYSYTITSAYRSKESQQSIWTTRLYNYINAGYSDATALAMVKAYVAKPGYSEHQLGLAIDISGSTQVCNWLAGHCWEYGFILRYPEGKSDITGIAYERWHFRYLGTELAAEINGLGVTLEEYMDMLTASAGSDAGTASDPEVYTNCAADNAA